MKLCKDCEHCSQEGSTFSKCNKIVGRKIDPINGTMLILKPRFVYCSIIREHGRFFCRTMNVCGKEARWFKPKGEKKQ